MNRKQALFTFGGEHEQFDLSALDEVDHLVLITAGVNGAVSGNLDGARIFASRAATKITPLLFELVGLRSYHERGHKLESLARLDVARFQ